jgi:hypothetical protein
MFAWLRSIHDAPPLVLTNTPELSVNFSAPLTIARRPE